MSKEGKGLIAYASAFAAFVLPKLNNVKEIILFGSTAREEAGKESDVDLFFDVDEKRNEEKIKNILERETNKFYKSKIAETFIVKGIKNQIKNHVGVLSEWDLKRSIISDGITLYGEYKEIPEKQKHLALFVIKPIKNIAKRNKIIRLLFGRKEDKYEKKGLLEEINGKIISPRSFVVSASDMHRIIKLFSKEKTSYQVFEFWSDQF